MKQKIVVYRGCYPNLSADIQNHHQKTWQRKLDEGWEIKSMFTANDEFEYAITVIWIVPLNIES
jgi:hypothetical protein